VFSTLLVATIRLTRFSDNSKTDSLIAMHQHRFVRLIAWMRTDTYSN